MISYVTAEKHPLTFKSLGRLATKRRATTSGHDTTVKRRKYDFNQTTIINGNDDVNDSVDWSAWSLGRHQIRSPRPEFDLDSSDEDGHSCSSEDTPTLDSDDQGTTECVAKLKKPLTLQDLGENEIETKDHRDLTSQLADERRTCDKTLFPQLPASTPSPERALPPGKESPLSNPNYMANLTSIDSSVCETPDASRDPAPQTLQNDAQKPYSHPPQPHNIAPCQSPSHDMTHGYPAAVSTAGRRPGLGFQLRLFRRAFEDERRRRDMQCLLDRLVGMTLCEGVAVETVDVFVGEREGVGKG